MAGAGWTQRVREWLAGLFGEAATPAPPAGERRSAGIVELPGEGGAMYFAIPRDRAAVSAFCALIETRLGDRTGLDALRAFQIAFDELLTNVVSYADGGSDEPIGVALDAGGGTTTATIRYRATAYDPTARASPDTTLAIADRGIGGLGVHLVQTMMDEFTHAYVDGYNVLTLRKRG
jgi:anti-sigma regulatory factor (Ser/Thr protein kinase)